ncbi:MAG: MotA/TolQ/ExbB proton channel family protein [Planctomycetia bacterium]|nr:MotA/TolQ/ExbB proton channel family protein [Planctomycetia bacterium]
MPGLDRVQTLWQLFLAGGFLMWPIVAMSLIVATFGIERLVALRSGRFVPQGFRAGIAALTKGSGFDPRAAWKLCEQFPSAAASVVKAMLEKIGRPVPEIEHAAEVTKDREASRLYANIRPISLAVTVTPLLGLLGTVQGMILAFYTTANLEAGANRAAELAQGIYVALITTFAGLCVAIPAAMIAHYLEGRILRGFRGVDDLVDRVLPALERYEGKGRMNLAASSAAVERTPPPVPPGQPSPAGATRP